MSRVCHEATPCGFFPQVDDEQAEDEGLET